VDGGLLYDERECIHHLNETATVDGGTSEAEGDGEFIRALPGTAKPAGGGREGDD
jgi:hypothetical protein